MASVAESASEKLVANLPSRFLISDLCALLETYLEPQPIKNVYHAYLFSAAAHEGQTRLTGEPYIYHPLAVARILAGMHMDAQTITAAILHDVIEDTETAKDQITDEFGKDVANLVDGVSKLTHLEFESKQEAQAENFRKMMLAFAKDIRVIIIKLSDRLHNMRTISVMSVAKRKRIARETLDIYAPIAMRLGMSELCMELEELSFQTLWPHRFEVLRDAVKRTNVNRKKLLQEVEKKICEKLERADIVSRIHGREKNTYSIYRKMKEKRLQFSEVFDVFGFRIVVEDVDTCYRVIGVIHNLYKPVPGKFKDYIAIPKKNAYQSLHTVLFGPRGIPIEVQVRSEEMDQVAQSGIAAHWMYKGSKLEDAAPHTRTREWLKSVSEMQHSSGSSLEFLESVKIDLFYDEIYVFTPRGDIMELPTNATAVDFAYAVHSDIGNHCVAARINRRLEPLNTVLENGQTIDIITSPDAHPNPAWLNFIVTAKARTNIRSYLKNLQREEARVLGRRLLDQALQAYGKSWEDVGKRDLVHLLKELQLESEQQLFEEVGLGDRMAPFVIKYLVSLRERWIRLRRRSDRKSPLAIRGTEGMVVTYGKCCHPIPGDPVVGVMTSGRGLVVHYVKCRNISRSRLQSRDKWIHVYWSSTQSSEFTAGISIKTADEPGVLAVVAAKISEEGSNIENIMMDEKHGETTTITVLLTVKDRDHLARIIRAVRNTPKIYKVKRI
ncbi:MAG: bifunctional (p)ppGpp synthetase/guanosine-3',5'-bis(diphosphate) 3'-pyrophosphohydrolase [Gammaproteobacteria bacterium]|nr:bifunctional (p)ppGpp synthetase/guanosine-3',5'-bis(diphosphate) 3'-pyrophosphohydrolase [Gammaproteobacteria bacterium]